MGESLTVSEHLAHEACEFSFDQLPRDVIDEAKRRLIDTLACGIGGSDASPSGMVRDLIADIGGRPEATIWGSGTRTSCANAALANGVMVRFTEAMDRGLTHRDGLTQHAHPGEVIPVVIAVGERVRATGKDVIAAIVLGYQLLNRSSEAMGGARAASALGWKPEIRAGFILPLIVGKLLRLDEEQMVHAVGISGSYTGELGVMDSPVEGRTMARELKFPYAAYQAVIAALLAQKGFQGPRRVFEGHQGFAEVICRGKVDLARFVQREDDFSIRYTQTKLFPINGRLQGQIEAILKLANDHEFMPEAISRVRIWTTRHVVERMGDPGTHKYPATKETADHSAYFTAALALIDRKVGLDLGQFGPERLHDPKLHAMIDKIELIAVPEWTEDQAPTDVEIRLRDGATHRCRVEYPKGHTKNPLTDAEIEAKFSAMAGRLMSAAQIRDVLKTIRQLDEIDDIGTLARAMVIREA